MGRRRVKVGCAVVFGICGVLSVLCIGFGVWSNNQPRAMRVAIEGVERVSIEQMDAGRGNRWLLMRLSLTATSNLTARARWDDFTLAVEGIEAKPDRGAMKLVEQATGARAVSDKVEVSEYGTEFRFLVFRAPAQGQHYALSLTRVAGTLDLHAGGVPDHCSTHPNANPYADRDGDRQATAVRDQQPANASAADRDQCTADLDGHRDAAADGHAHIYGDADDDGPTDEHARPPDCDAGPHRHVAAANRHAGPAHGHSCTIVATGAGYGGPISAKIRRE